MGSAIVVGISRENIAKLVLTLVAMEVALALAYFLAMSVGKNSAIMLLFNLNGEKTIPCWFSAMQLMVIGLVFLFSKSWGKIDQIKNSGFLLLVGLGFLFLSMDEATGFHQVMNARLRQFEWSPRLFSGNHGIWMPIYFGIAIVVAGAGFRTVISIARVYPFQFLVLVAGFIVFVIGGVGMQAINFLFLDAYKGTFVYSLEIIFEEILEMLGASIMLYGALGCVFESSSTQAVN